MYYNMYPDVNMSRQNKQYYEREYGTDYKSVRNKALNYMTHYYFQTGVEGNLCFMCCVDPTYVSGS